MKMENLNKMQLDQVEELKSIASEEFVNSILQYTCFVTREELNNIFKNALELEAQEDCVKYILDVNYYEVVSYYCELEKNEIGQAFGYYGDFDLYMDEKGRGLIVGYY